MPSETKKDYIQDDTIRNLLSKIALIGLTNPKLVNAAIAKRSELLIAIGNGVLKAGKTIDQSLNRVVENTPQEDTLGNLVEKSGDTKAVLMVLSEALQSIFEKNISPVAEMLQKQRNIEEKDLNSQNPVVGSPRIERESKNHLITIIERIRRISIVQILHTKKSAEIFIKEYGKIYSRLKSMHQAEGSFRRDGIEAMRKIIKPDEIIEIFMSEVHPKLLEYLGDKVDDFDRILASIKEILLEVLNSDEVLRYIHSISNLLFKEGNQCSYDSLVSPAIGETEKKR